MPVSVSKIGHIVLKVEDLDPALAFYCGVLGLEEVARRDSQQEGGQPPDGCASFGTWLI